MKTSRLPIFLALILTGGLTTSVTIAEDKPFLHGLFMDHMVLQRDAEIRVWGWTDPGKNVTVSLAGKTASTVAGKDGKWLARLAALSAGGPHELKIAGPETVILQDVLVGDVWLCSGQSNMAQGIGVSRDAEKQIAAADWPKIRLYTVPGRIAMKPEAQIESEWLVCTPETIAKGGWGGFSAVGYYFGRHLHRNLNVPIGLIHSSWGGTPAESWTSARELGKLAPFRKDVVTFRELAAKLEKNEDSFDEILDKWWRERDPGMASGSGWMQAAFDDSGWKEAELPRSWEDSGMADFDGVAWYRRAITIPEEWAGKELTLSLGPIDDQDITWFNGVKIGETRQWDEPRKYTVPADSVKAERTVITVRMVDTGGGGGINGEQKQMRLEGPKGSDPFSLAGKWRIRVGPSMKKLGKVPTNPAKNPHRVSVLFNGMISPLVPLSIKGAIWYQGESNAGRWQNYRELLTAMVGDWRSRFESGEFPFLIVQLANYMRTRLDPVDTDWARLREAQAQVAASIENGGLAVAIDIGESNDIHPKNKQDVGERLALAARALGHGEKLVYSGPVYREMKREGRSIRAMFDHCGKGLTANNVEKLEGFSIAGKDRKFHWARAAIDGNSVVVSSGKVKKPVAVRYAWEDNPMANLYNSAGLPAVPFRTDDWDRR